MLAQVHDINLVYENEININYHLYWNNILSEQEFD